MLMSDKKEQAKISLSYEEICDYIPHRYPFLMVDKIEDITLYEEATGIKNLASNEPFFQGHFPNHPIFPGVLMVEALAQTAAILVHYSLAQTTGKQCKYTYLASIERSRFRQVVVPGDQLRLRVKKIFKRGRIWRYEGEAVIRDTEEVAASTIFTAIVADK